MRSKLAVILSSVGAALVLAQVAAAAPLPLPARLLQATELSGFRADQGIAHYGSAALWVQADPALTTTQRTAEVARLRREGFKGLVQRLYARGTTQEAVSWVMQLGSASAARAELVALLDKYKARDVAMGATFTPYTVAAIPGARGFGLRGGGQAGENVFFTDGPFLYLVGVGWPTSATKPPTRATLIAAVTKLHARVRGR